MALWNASFSNVVPLLDLRRVLCISVKLLRAFSFPMSEILSCRMIEYFCCMNLSNSSRIIGLSMSFMKGWMLFMKRGGINSSLPISLSFVAIEYPVRVYLYILSIHSRTIRVLYLKESPSLPDKALIAQNKALPAVLLPESLIPVMTVKPPISIEVKHA